MPSHSEGPGIWLSVWFLLTQCLYERAAEVLARLRACAGSPEPSLLAYAISTKFAWRGPIDAAMVVTDLSISFLLVYVDYGCILEFLWYSLLRPHAVKQLYKCLCHWLTSGLKECCRFCIWTFGLAQWQMLNRFHCFRDSWEFIKQNISLHL